jgi:chaperone modulatory protein CbpM
MKYNIIQVCHGKILDDENDLSLIQLCDICNLTPELIIEMVNEGILDPTGENKKSWRFSYTIIERVHKVQRLQNDLNVNLAGAALALHLLEKIEQLETIIEIKQR